MTFEMFTESTKSEKEVGCYPQFLTSGAMKIYQKVQNPNFMCSCKYIYIYILHLYIYSFQKNLVFKWLKLLLRFGAVHFSN